MQIKFSIFTLIGGIALLTGLIFSGQTQAKSALYGGNLDEIASNVATVKIEVDLDDWQHNPSWELPQTKIPIFFKKLSELDKTVDMDGLADKLTYPNSGYKGIIIYIHNKDGGNTPTIRVYKDIVTDISGARLFNNNLELEYWLFGAQNQFEQRNLAFKTLPIISFAQCLALGNPIIDTEPRQCLLPNDDLFLDINTLLDENGLNINNFDGCLENGTALINTFPRRCVAAGGRVYTEPARVRNSYQ